MMSINFEGSPRVPQLAIGYLSPLRRAACRRPARLAALVGGAAFCVSLAMTAASVPAAARSASDPGAIVSTESERLPMDEFSSRRGHHGGKGGGYGAGYAGGGYGDRSFKSRGYKAGYSGGGFGDRSFKSRGHGGRHHGGSTFGGYTGFGPRAYW